MDGADLERFATQAAAAIEQADWSTATRLYEKALDAVPETPSQLRGDLLLNLSGLALQRGDGAESLTRLAEAQAVYEKIGPNGGRSRHPAGPA